MDNVTNVKIEKFESKYREAFRSLNEEWITRYFTLEEPDRAALGDPESYIIAKGGEIFVAVAEGEAVGVCALLKRDIPHSYELAKMAVSPSQQGRNIGYHLGLAAIERARELGAESVYLESNTSLKPAIRTYEKLGFKEVKGRPTPYARCDIQMELRL